MSGGALLARSSAMRLSPLVSIRTWLTTTAYRVRPEVALPWLIGAHVVLKIAVFPLVVHAAPLGDESAYLNGGRALSNVARDLASFTAPDTAEVQRNVVASGWFMPGMSVLVAPLYVVVPGAPTWLARGYLGVLTLALFLVVVRYVARRLGPGRACVLVVLPGLIPSWVVFSYGAWGDLCAGLVLVVLVVQVVELFRASQRGEPPTVRSGVRLGLVAVALLYLRSSTSALLLGVGVVVVVLTLTTLRGADRRRATTALVAGGVVFGALLAPWSLLASHTLGGRVLTTTSMPTAMANTFGDRQQVCFGPCDPDSTLWFRPLRYAREVARATGTSEVTVLKQMSHHALRDVRPQGYLEQVGHDFDSYSMHPNDFTGYLAPAGGRGATGRFGQTVADRVTWMLYAPLLLLGLLSLLLVARSSTEARVLDLVLKVSLGALLVQPFVHLAGGRYWTTAGPVVALAAGVLLHELRKAPARTTGAARPALDRWLGRAQLLAALGAAAVTVVLVAVA